jgi:hypothetical protein
MHRRSSLTLLRGLLLSLFVLGGPGLPLIDAMVWHGSGTAQVPGLRLDAAGAARTHSDVCSLGARPSVPGPVPCAAPSTLVARLAERTPAGLLPLVRVHATPGRSARPRAPPVFSA